MSSCQTAPVRFDKYSEGTWQSRALVRDKVASKSYVLNMDVTAIRDKNLRVDVTTPLGDHLASLVAEGDQVQYVLPKEQKFFYGQANDRVLSPILAIPLNPLLFQNILFDLPIQASGWECQRDENKFLKECVDQNKQMTIQWRQRMGRSKSVFVEHSKGSLQINFQKFKAKIDEPQEVFKLEPPAGFKKYRIR